MSRIEGSERRRGSFKCEELSLNNGGFAYVGLMHSERVLNYELGHVLDLVDLHFYDPCKSERLVEADCTYEEGSTGMEQPSADPEEGPDEL